jgi:superfamily II DNA or RNA helicase
MGYLIAELDAEAGYLTQQRGRDYFSRGAVRAIDGDEQSVTATVQGSQRYKVELNAMDGFLDYSCSCPFFERDFDVCKHIWAAALAAEQRGYLKDILTWDEPEESEPRGTNPGRWTVSMPAAPKNPPEPSWKQQLQSVRVGTPSAVGAVRDRAASERELIYFIDVDYALSRGRLNIEANWRERKMNGEWGKFKSQRIYARDIAGLKNPADRKILAILFGARQEYSYGYSSDSDSTTPQFTPPRPLWEVLLPLLCATGRLRLRSSKAPEAGIPLQWDDGPPWELCLQVTPLSGGAGYQLTGSLRREGSEMALDRPKLLLSGGLVFYEGRVARLDDRGDFGWILLLRSRPSLSIPKSEGDAFLDELVSLPHPARIVLPEELRFETACVVPKPRLVIRGGRKNIWKPTNLVAELSFDYDGTVIPHQYDEDGIYQKARRRLLTRDRTAEENAKARLQQLGFRKGWEFDRADLALAPDLFPKVMRALSAEGWHVEAEGNVYRMGGTLRMEVNSGVDWFDIEGGADFGDTQVALPRLLRAIKQGEHTVKLDDGTLGVIPEEWVKKYGMLAGLGRAEEDRLRFTRSQAGLLDALLASEPEVSFDAVFERMRQELREFAGISAAAPTADFQGDLRSYQREGLGWLYFLQRFGFGGCLADDMGLGKTIQVLALLESRRELRSGANGNGPRPSLVVAPRSLVFHWKEEAKRFAPRLRVLDHTGGARLKPGDHFDDYDVILTTYGTLRRDAVQFKDQRFDYCVLDEAQAIKNAGTLSAKAVRLLHADHRLAMSGTPVENHLGELWSLFEFLNPGMLGSASIFASAGRNPDERTRMVLGKALRPFILRRTKGQVATELPEKTEQTIYCDLDSTDRKLYTELRDYYRARLLKNGAGEGSGQFKIQVLEALLRLRQAACHPGLIDKGKTAESSSKLDTLLAQLDQVLEENHKVLVFSQFTSLLAIVRSRLDKAEIPYVYLDGRTRDRQARVEQFQNDPTVKLFLISLKAGGLGLNLHAAEYVYLLDPWWNPAVEAQAIDRAHRIGQTRRVFAYRLIARDTVEEKVLELQKTKRDLADAIISADNSLMHNLTREDLELLLS